MPLKRIRRTPRLERSAPQHFRACLGHSLRRGKQLLPRLDRTRSSHYDNFVSANADALLQFDDRPLRTKTSPRQLVRRTDAMDFLDTGQQLENPDIEINA